MTRFKLLTLVGALVAPAAAVASVFPIVETEFATFDVASLPAAAEPAAPQGKAVAAAPASLQQIDHAYLNRHLADNLQESNAALRALLAAQPRDPDLLWRMARGLSAEGSRQTDRDGKLKTFGEAEALLGTALAARPDDVESHYWLARIYADQNEIKRTLGLAKAMRRELETAIRLDPRHADAHHYLGELLRQMPGIFGGDKQKAVAELEEAVRLAPNEATHYPALAEAYLAVKDKTRAIEAARKTLALKDSDDPGDFEGSKKDAREFLSNLGAN